MSKHADNTLISSVATNRTPAASLFNTNQENQEDQEDQLPVTTSQIDDNRLLLSLNSSSTKEMTSTQALQVLKLQAEATNNGDTFALLNDQEITNKLSSMDDQIQSLSSTICVMSDDIFKKSALIADLTKQLQCSEQERIKLSMSQHLETYIGNETTQRVLLTESNLPINTASSAPSFQTNQSDSTPPVSIALLNEHTTDSPPPFVACPSSNIHPDGSYEPEIPIYCNRPDLKKSRVNHMLQLENEHVPEITELNALLSKQDQLINALVTIANEEFDLLKILLLDEYYFPEDIDTIPSADRSIDVIKEACVQLTRDDTDLRRSVKNKLIELKEFRFSMKLLGNMKQQTDDRLITVAQKVSTTLSKFERMFCYFVILALCTLLFGQWIVNPWKYN